MKTYFLACLCLGILNTATAQNDIAAVTNLNLTKVNTKTVKANADYLNMLEADVMAERALKLRTLVADYNIENSKVYKKKQKSIYTVNFKEGDSKVEATYNSKGKIIQCNETYKDIRLPLHISQQLIKDNPGYYIGDITCKFKYNAHHNIKTISYKVELLNDTNRKGVRL